MIKIIQKIFIVIPPLVNTDEEGNLNSDRPDFESRRLVSPVEPATAAAHLRSTGFEVRLFDMGLFITGRFESLEASLLDFKPDAVAIVQSILTFATAQDWNGKRVFDLARCLTPKVTTILTGSQATNYPGQAVKEGVCDFSIRGEVDFALGELLAALNSNGDLSKIPGLTYRTETKAIVVTENYPIVDITQLPLPAYDLISKEDKDKYSKILERGKIRYPEKSHYYRDIMTSRSCVLRCSFCCVAQMRGEQQKYRRKTLQMVMAEIESALQEGIEEIHFFDDLFVQNEKQIIDFVNEIMKRKLKFHWFVSQGMPLWPLTKNALIAMKEAGMYRIICPFESGSDRVLKKVIGKVHSTTAHHHDVIQWANKAGIEIIGMFVVGMPGETRRDILDTVLFAESHPEVDYSVFSIATPMIGTKLMKQVTKEGRLGDQGKINRVIKRTVALYRTEEFSEYEMGVIRAFDWDRINFSVNERCVKYARMAGITEAELDQLRKHSKQTFHRFFPNYDGPLSFKDLYDKPGLYRQLDPVIPKTLY